jgi:hypothetical protein
MNTFFQRDIYIRDSLKQLFFGSISCMPIVIKIEKFAAKKEIRKLFFLKVHNQSD